MNIFMQDGKASVYTKHDAALERDVLGVLLRYPARMHDSGVSDRHFYQEVHRRILEGFRSKGPSPHVVSEAAYEDLQLVEDICEGGWSDASLKTQLEHLERLAEIRESALAARKLLADLEEADAMEARDMIQDATGKLAGAVHTNGATGSFGHEAKKRLTSKTGERMKLHLPGFFVRRGDLVFLAATPGSGKTTMAVNCLDHLLQNFDGLDVMFSLEMSDKEIYAKRIQTMFGRSIMQYLDELDEDGNPVENQDYIRAAEKVEEWYASQKGTLRIESAGGITVDQIRAKCLELQAVTGKKLRCVVIDQLDKVAHKHRTGDSQTFGVKATTAALKILAEELQVAIICLVQISNKAGQEKELKTIRDVFGSSGPEQDGSQVWILQMDPTEDPEAVHRRTIIKREKCRNGSIGFGHNLIFDVRASTMKVGGF